MKNLQALAYTSTAINCSIEKIESILIDAREFNLQHGLTGVLLYSHGSFLQYLEGEEDMLSAVYARIRNARSHKNIGLLMLRDIDERSFDDWQMGYGELTSSEMLTLSTAGWQQRYNAATQQSSADQSSRHSPGQKLLKTFWMVAETRMESMALMGYAK